MIEPVIVVVGEGVMDEVPVGVCEGVMEPVIVVVGEGVMDEVPVGV